MSDASGHHKGTPSSQDFVVRAPGALHKGLDYFLGKFPSGFTEFKSKKTGWSIRRQPEEKVANRRPEHKKPRVLPWVLEDKPGHVTHTGQPEGGITGSGAGMGYFILIKEGPHFTALPVKDWYNFRPSLKNQALSLEEAERQMNSRGTGIRLNAGSKLGALAAKAEEAGGEVQDGDDDGEAPDSDEDREEQRVARMRKAADIENDKAAEADDEDMPSAKVNTDKGEKGEDWEHEDERADDDLNQGDEDGSDQDVPSSVKKQKRVKSEEESDAEENGLTEAGQQLQRILKETHLSSGSEDDDGRSSGHIAEDDDDDDDDDVDLDAMASDLMPKAKSLREPTPPVSKGTKQPTSESKTPAGKAGSKRKAATPPVQEAKKAKPGVKQEAKPVSSTQSEASSGPPSAQEILSSLKAWGPVTAGELTARFRKRLATPQDKQAFTANVKKVSKLEERPPGSGKKFVVIK